MAQCRDLRLVRSDGRLFQKDHFAFGGDKVVDVIEVGADTLVLPSKFAAVVSLIRFKPADPVEKLSVVPLQPQRLDEAVFERPALFGRTLLERVEGTCENLVEDGARTVRFKQLDQDVPVVCLPVGARVTRLRDRTEHVKKCLAEVEPVAAAVERELGRRPGADKPCRGAGDTVGVRDGERDSRGHKIRVSGDQPLDDRFTDAFVLFELPRD